MTLEISWPAVGTGCVVLTFVGKVIHGVFSAALERRDDAIKGLVNDLAKKKTDHDADVSALRATQKILFEKLDNQAKEFHQYQLHVSESYVNREVLREALAPIKESLKDIRDDLQEASRK